MGLMIAHYFYYISIEIEDYFDLFIKKLSSKIWKNYLYFKQKASNIN